MASEFTQIKELLDKHGGTFEEFRKANDARIDALQKGADSRARELSEKVDKANSDLDAQLKEKRRLEVEITNQRERIEELETRAKSPGKTVAQKLNEEYEAKFMTFMRRGMDDPGLGQELKTIQRQLIEMKDVTVGTQSQGGYGLPKVIANEIERQEKLYSPVTDDCQMFTVGTTDYHELVDLTGASSGWVGETGSRSATLTGALRDITPTWGENYAYPQASQWSLDDLQFDVTAWLARSVADCFAVDIGTAVVSGNGTTKPTGMLNTTPTLIDDFASPLRTAAVYQYIASTASPDAILADSIIDVVYKLNSRYRAGARYFFNSVTAGQIRKLKDTTNQYLWQPSFQQGTPDILNGYPFSIWEQMPTVTQGQTSKAVGFGNIPRGYLLVQRTGMTITRDEVTNPGYVRFYIRRRVGGIPLNNNAIKFIGTA